MMIELEIPDWCVDRWLYLMAGIELVAFKWPNQEWKIKTGRCNKCGRCCPPNQSKPRCENLKQVGGEKVCSLGSGRPWSCSVYMDNTLDGCTEAFK